MRTTTINHYFGAKNAPPIQSVFDLIEVSRRGLSKKAVSIMARHLGITLTDLFVILHISARTWQRYTDEKLLPQDVTEKALQLANLYKQGEDIFGNPEKFKGWMNHPSPIFGGKKPIDLLDTQFGFQAIQDELVRIDWGVLA
ncbi:type II RES/Xre toxin-antitoxin system antitoxin [Spirosoma endophyticum]|uniref:Putative toxin-antitoxin system antitoxin component, TIGR02293 family n=1 Tax=Spirosoma endophyticum TaxID=662367 RepID=A0A1I1N1F3_9BACT|nr:antitoxin Xre/MbcA/ParS toxin-binding domain-containing protein [Spirosoma endophyticum]SFC91002.1 putative toxin-antitoxin system antitoxin component, TIGR02293 family [Spirosoma endophyticum]